ncbi:S-type pyocin domain-containing protein, partial [Klebsiella pneumoniae]|uniref:S-type pyocin domain-containing protein n=1 Tax=Klebsiella pneumoniae TaxID=573 RepID=UPI00292C38F2
VTRAGFIRSGNGIRNTLFFIVHSGELSNLADDLDFDDIILVFPPESGLKPLYVMYRSPRNMPGTVSGKGQNVGNNWMGGASTGDGAPVPS